MVGWLILIMLALLYWFAWSLARAASRTPPPPPPGGAATATPA